jgi:hypothetical protein
MLIIPTTWEAEFGRLEVSGQSEQKVSWTSITTDKPGIDEILAMWKA